jgi:phosphatidate cytidylyltransferase
LRKGAETLGKAMSKIVLHLPGIMALHLKNLFTRSLSALVFVILLAGCVYWNYYSFSLFFFIVAMLGLNEFYKISGKLGSAPLKAAGFTSGVLLYLCFFKADSLLPLPLMSITGYFWSVLLLFPFIIFALALFLKRENVFRDTAFTMAGPVYCVFPFALLNSLATGVEPGSGQNYFEPLPVLGVIFLIWSNDTFAYLGGSLFGKHKMIERVSPGKTWEGTLTGVLITFGLSFTFNSWLYDAGPYLWPLLGMVVPVLATVGDLVESKLKREAGIKDSGNIMPGHGGVLDRFDSLIFASPFVFVLFQLFKP